MSRIVVGIDGSDHSKQALKWALDEARLRGASLRAVYAWTIPIFVGDGFAPVPLPNPVELSDTAAKRLDGVVDGILGGATDVEVERRVVEGPAAQTLVEEAAGADLLVVGSRGRGGFAGLLLGSVSQQCAHHAPCPVVIIRAVQA